MKVKNRTVVFPRQNGTCPKCDGVAAIIKSGLEDGMRAGKLVIPEALPLLFNVADKAECRDHGKDSPCKAPVFSVFKDRRDLDVLMPHFKPRSWDPVGFVPWERKRAIAFFR